MAHVPERKDDMSSYTEGQIHQLAEALEKAKFTPNDLTKLGQFPDLASLLAVLHGGRVISKPDRSWRVGENGTIYFTVTSNGMNGKQWIKHLEKLGFRIGDYAKSVLLSSDFKPTSGVTAEIAVLPGSLFKDDARITSNIRLQAENGTFKQGQKLSAPNAEVACLIREMFSDKEIEAMGLIWIVTMHEPIKDSDGDPSLLGAGRSGGGRWLGACFGKPDVRWDRENGFAFVVSQAA